MEFLTALEGAAPVAALRTSLWAYPVVNAAHIVGIALLFGAVVPLDLRLLGVWRDVPVAALSRVLVPVAVAGFALAACAGAMMFSVQATKYAPTALFQFKLALILCALVNALVVRRMPSWAAAKAAGPGHLPPARLRLFALVSLALWLSVIVAGRFLGYR